MQSFVGFTVIPNAWPWMTLKFYFTLSSGLPVGVKYLAYCCLHTDLLRSVACHFPTLPSALCLNLQRKTRKLSHRKDDRAMRSISSALKIFDSPWVRPGLLFLKFLMGFSADWCYRLRICVQNLKSVPEIIGGTQKWGSPWIRPSSLFTKFLMGFCSNGSCECSCQIWSS